MSTKVYVRSLIWITVLLSTCCNSDTLNITEESTVVLTATPITTAATPTTNPPTPSSEETTTAPTTTIGLPPIALQNPVILCKCGSSKVMSHTGQCQPWRDGITVPIMDTLQGPSNQGPLHIDTAEFNVSVREPECHYQQVDVQEDQFILRLRGGKTDLLVTDGDLRGLRVSDYCVHHQQSGSQVKVTAKGCVSHPKIKRCCSTEKQMNNSECIPNSNIALPFNPPLATGPHGERGLAGAPFPWDDRQEYVNKPTCEPGNVLKKVELDGRRSFLAALPQFVLLSWLEDGDKRHNIFPQQYCVDTPGDDGSHYAYSCQWDLASYCKTNVCNGYTLKCCPEHQVLHVASRSCVTINLPFNPPFPSPSTLTTLYGYPVCDAPLARDIANFTLLQNGSLVYKDDDAYSFDQFCLDTLLHEDSAELGAVACTVGVQAHQKAYWPYIKSKLFPVCYMMSCAFLALFLLLQAWIPKLRENEGKYQTFHAISLFVAYAILLTTEELIPHGFTFEWGGICMALAFLLQFSFLSAFFWINTMCYDVWRLYRNLVKNMSTAPVSSVATWKYILYALGGPLSITVITIIIQYEAPKDGSIPWLIHPHIGEGRCGFRDLPAMLPYYMVPIAILFLINFIFIGITYHNMRIIRREYRSADGPMPEESTRMNQYLATFWPQFYLLVLMSASWLTELLSFLIGPEELWAPTDLLNTLQGVFVFFVFLTHHEKRALLKGELPRLLKISNVVINNVDAAQNNIHAQNQALEKKVVHSAKMLNIWPFTSRSTSSLNLEDDDPSTSTSPTGITLVSLTQIEHGKALSDNPKHPILNQSVPCQSDQHNSNNVNDQRNKLELSGINNDSYHSE